MSLPDATFDGATLQTADQPRLRGQLLAVFEIMDDSMWHTLEDIQNRLNAVGRAATTPSVSARLRDLRKEKFGSYIVDRRKVTLGNKVVPGLYEYRVRMPVM